MNFEEVVNKIFIERAKFYEEIRSMSGLFLDGYSRLSGEGTSFRQGSTGVQERRKQPRDNEQAHTEGERTVAKARKWSAMLARLSFLGQFGKRHRRCEAIGWESVGMVVSKTE